MHGLSFRGINSRQEGEYDKAESLIEEGISALLMHIVLKLVYYKKKLKETTLLIV